MVRSSNGAAGAPSAGGSSAVVAPAPEYTDSSRVSPVVQASAAGVTSAALTAVTMSDVMNWTAQGVSDDDIIARIEHSDVIFRLTAADEVQMRDARVSNQVIHAIAAMQRRSY